MSLCISLKCVNVAFFYEMGFVSINIYHLSNDQERKDLERNDRERNIQGKKTGSVKK